jgi:cyclohexanecarboxyl-CoA dehydrogenase
MGFYPRPARDETFAELRKDIREFCREHDLARLCQQLDARPRFPREVFALLGSRGWLGSGVAAEFEGAGWPLSREAVVIEELAREGGSVFAKLALQPNYCSILRQGSGELRARWYSPLLRGTVLVGNQITEPDAGSDVASMAMVAEKQGDEYVLQGSKSGIAFAEDAEAAIVLARTGGSPGAKGVSAFLVPQRLQGDLGERWMRRGRVSYNQVRVPASHLIGREGEAFSYLMTSLTHERVLLSVIYLALADASLRTTIDHVMQRKAFGRVIGSFEAVSFPLVEGVARLEAARLLVERTIARHEQGQKVDAEASLCKWLSNETALRILDDAIQFHGSLGYSNQAPHEQRWRDVRSGGIAHGTREILHVVAAREILGRESLPYGADGKR